MTVQVTAAQEERLASLADATSRTPEDLAQEGLDRFLAYEEDVLATVKRGRADLQAGRTVEPHEVQARLERITAA